MLLGGFLLFCINFVEIACFSLGFDLAFVFKQFLVGFSLNASYDSIK